MSWLLYLMGLTDAGMIYTWGSYPVTRPAAVHLILWFYVIETNSKSHLYCCVLSTTWSPGANYWTHTSCKKKKKKRIASCIVLGINVSCSVSPTIPAYQWISKRYNFDETLRYTFMVLSGMSQQLLGEVL